MTLKVRLWRLINRTLLLKAWPILPTARHTTRARGGFALSSAPAGAKSVARRTLGATSTAASNVRRRSSVNYRLSGLRDDNLASAARLDRYFKKTLSYSPSLLSCSSRLFLIAGQNARRAPTVPRRSPGFRRAARGSWSQAGAPLRRKDTKVTKLMNCASAHQLRRIFAVL